MNQYYLIDTIQIKQYLSKSNKLDPERPLCWLDLLIENIQNNLLGLKNNKLMIEIDNQKKLVTLLWEKLPTENWKIIFDKEKTNESIYNTFIFALDYVNQKKWWGNMIKKIEPKKE